MADSGSELSFVWREETEASLIPITLLTVCLGHTHTRAREHGTLEAIEGEALDRN